MERCYRQYQRDKVTDDIQSLISIRLFVDGHSSGEDCDIIVTGIERIVWEQRYSLGPLWRTDTEHSGYAQGWDCLVDVWRYVECWFAALYDGHVG